MGGPLPVLREVRSCLYAAVFVTDRAAKSGRKGDVLYCDRQLWLDGASQHELHFARELASSPREDTHILLYTRDEYSQSIFQGDSLSLSTQSRRLQLEAEGCEFARRAACCEMERQLERATQLEATAGLLRAEIERQTARAKSTRSPQRLRRAFVATVFPQSCACLGLWWERSWY